LVIVITGNQL